jgi:hypothetical protein
MFVLMIRIKDKIKSKIIEIKAINIIKDLKKRKKIKIISLTSN